MRSLITQTALDSYSCESADLLLQIVVGNLRYFRHKTSERNSRDGERRIIVADGRPGQNSAYPKRLSNAQMVQVALLSGSRESCCYFNNYTRAVVGTLVR